MKIDYVLLSEIIKSNIDIMGIISFIVEATTRVKDYYPDYENWFRYKHIPGVIKGERDTILAIYDYKIIGVCNIKIIDEKKICTLYVNYYFRRKRIGSELVKIATNLLKIDNPLITMPENCFDNYKGIINFFDWKVMDVVDNCYKDGNKELVFNGKLDNIYDNYEIKNGIWLNKKLNKKFNDINY